MRLALGIAVIAVAFPMALYIHERRVSVVTQVAQTPAQVDPTNCSDYFPGSTGLHSAYCSSLQTDELLARRHPSWEDPVALLLVLGGLAVAVGIVATGRSA